MTVFTETEKQMVRVERVSQYIEDTPQEKHKSKNVRAHNNHYGLRKFRAGSLYSTMNFMGRESNLQPGVMYIIL